MLGFFKPILYIMGLFLTGLGIIMLVPGLVDIADGHPDAEVFFLSAAITIFLGSMFALTNRGDVSRLEARQAFVLTTVSWIVVTAFGALPFVFSRLDLSLADAYFEAMSGLTTTGATVIVDLDSAPNGVLLWRGLLHGIGALGIVVMAVLILPFLRVGGAQLFRVENPDKSDRPFPRFVQLMTAITIVYLALVMLCTSALWLAGMPAFEAVVNSFSAVATGGFATSDRSIGVYDSLTIDWILVVFMLAGGVPLTWHVRVLRDGRRALNSDSQVWAFLVLAGVVSVAVSIWQLMYSDTAPLRAISLACFNVVSVLTTTGFAHEDYSTWGTFPTAVFFFLCFIGGCSGSTTGSIKIFRWQIFFLGLRRLVISNFQPNRVISLYYNNRRVAPETVFSVFSFILLYVVTFFVLTLVASLLGGDFVTSATGIAAMLSSTGPGLGDIIGPAGTYKPLSDPLKWLFSLAMLLGRLELLTIMVLLFPDFWRT